MIKFFCVPIICFLIFLALHIFTFHSVKVKRRFRTMVYLALIMVVVDIFLFFLLPDNLGEGFVKEDLLKYIYLGNALFLYFYIFYFYLHFIIVIDRSISVRILLEISSSPQRSLTLDEIKKRYDLKDKFKRELKDLVFLGRVEKKGEAFANTFKGRMHAYIVRGVRKYLNLAANR